MPKTKISEYSTTNSSNTDIEGINIDEGCPPSSINNAIRELMVHLKEFQTGASGDAFTFAGGTLMSGTNTISGAAVISGNINSSGTTNTFSGGNILSGTNTISGSAIISGNINSSGTTNTFSGGNILSGTNTFSGTNIFSSNVTLNAQSDLRFADSDSSNWVAFQAPATVASNVTWTLPAADGTSNQVLATNGSGTLSWSTASSSQWTTSGSDISYTTGSVGIGSSTIRGTLNVSDGTLNTAGEGVYQGYIVGADRSALTEGNLTVQSNDAMAVDKGGSISFGGRAVSASSAGANWARIAGRKETGTSAEYGGYLQFATRPNSGAMAERMRIDSSGNVGIGSTSPSTFNDAGTGGRNVVIQSTSTGRGILVFASEQTGGADEPLGKINFIDSDSTNTSYRGATITGMRGSDSNSAYLIFLTANSAAGAERMRITPAGEVYIAGTTDQGAYNLQCNGTGVWGAGAYVNGSDARIKDDIAPIESGLDVVEKLNPVTYRYKEDWSKDQSTQTGFIAQELLVALEGKNYVDGVVQQGGAEGYYSVAYQNIIPILTKAIQELNAKVQTLEAQNAAFETRLAALEAN